jgi:hypothetical protein
MEDEDRERRAARGSAGSWWPGRRCRSLHIPQLVVGRAGLEGGEGGVEVEHRRRPRGWSPTPARLLLLPGLLGRPGDDGLVVARTTRSMQGPITLDSARPARLFGSEVLGRRAVASGGGGAVLTQPVFGDAARVPVDDVRWVGGRLPGRAGRNRLDRSRIGLGGGITVQRGEPSCDLVVGEVVEGRYGAPRTRRGIAGSRTVGLPGAGPGSDPRRCCGQTWPPGERRRIRAISRRVSLHTWQHAQLIPAVAAESVSVRLEQGVRVMAEVESLRVSLGGLRGGCRGDRYERPQPSSISTVGVRGGQSSDGGEAVPGEGRVFVRI